MSKQSFLAQINKVNKRLREPKKFFQVEERLNNGPWNALRIGGPMDHTQAEGLLKSMTHDNVREREYRIVPWQDEAPLKNFIDILVAKLKWTKIDHGESDCTFGPYDVGYVQLYSAVAENPKRWEAFDRTGTSWHSTESEARTAIETAFRAALHALITQQE